MPSAPQIWWLSSDIVHFTNLLTYLLTLFAGCPTGVTITPSTGTFEVGDVLTCRADGYDPTYTWTGTAANGVTVSHTGSSYTLLAQGVFDLTCTATVNQLTSCNGTASVGGNAVGDEIGKY